MKFSLYFLGYEDPTDIPDDPKERVSAAVLHARNNPTSHAQRALQQGPRCAESGWSEAPCAVGQHSPS
jgi:hypothetical protein